MHVSIFTFLNSSDVSKHLNILKKQCELYATLGKIEDCEGKAKILIQTNDREVIMFVTRILSSLLSQLSHEALLPVRKHIETIKLNKSKIF